MISTISRIELAPTRQKSQSGRITLLICRLKKTRKILNPISVVPRNRTGDSVNSLSNCPVVPPCFFLNSIGQPVGTVKRHFNSRKKTHQQQRYNEPYRCLQIYHGTVKISTLYAVGMFLSLILNQGIA